MFYIKKNYVGLRYILKCITFQFRLTLSFILFFKLWMPCTLKLVIDIKII